MEKTNDIHFDLVREATAKYVYESASKDDWNYSIHTGLTGLLDMHRGVTASGQLGLRGYYDDYLFTHAYVKSGWHLSALEYDRKDYLHMPYIKVGGMAGVDYSSVHLGIGIDYNKALRTFDNKNWKIEGEIASLLSSNLQILDEDPNFAIDTTTNDLYFTGNQRFASGKTRGAQYLNISGHIGFDLSKTCNSAINTEIFYACVDQGPKNDDVIGVKLSLMSDLPNLFSPWKDSHAIYSNINGTIVHTIDGDTDFAISAALSIPLSAKKKNPTICKDEEKTYWDKMADEQLRYKAHLDYREYRNEHGALVFEDQVHNAAGLPVRLFYVGDVGSAGAGLADDDLADINTTLAGLDGTFNNLIKVGEDVDAQILIAADNIVLFGGGNNGGNIAQGAGGPVGAGAAGPLGVGVGGGGNAGGGGAGPVFAGFDSGGNALGNITFQGPASSVSPTIRYSGAAAAGDHTIIVNANNTVIANLYVDNSDFGNAIYSPGNYENLTIQDTTIRVQSTTTYDGVRVVGVNGFDILNTLFDTADGSSFAATTLNLLNVDAANGDNIKIVNTDTGTRVIVSLNSNGSITTSCAPSDAVIEVNGFIGALSDVNIANALGIDPLDFIAEQNGNQTTIDRFNF